MENFISFIKNFLKEDSITSILIISLILNIFYDLLKKIFFFSINYSVKKVKSSGLKNAKFLIRHYNEELLYLEKISETKNEKLFEIIDETYTIIFYFILVLGLFTIVKSFGVDINFFYFFMAASIFTIFKIILRLQYNYQLIKKLKNSTYYQKKMKEKILKLEEFLNKYDQHNNCK